MRSKKRMQISRYIKPEQRTSESPLSTLACSMGISSCLASDTAQAEADARAATACITAGPMPKSAPRMPADEMITKPAANESDITVTSRSRDLHTSGSPHRVVIASAPSIRRRSDIR